MNVAIIIAGGSGHRMGYDIPKQFINVYDKPILIYTLEGFQRHPEIDAIEVVCLRQTVRHRQAQVDRVRRSDRAGVDPERRLQP